MTHNTGGPAAADRKEYEMPRALWVLVQAWVVIAPAVATAAEPTKFSPADVEFFEKQIRPLLAEHCYECHGPKKQEAELRLDSRAGVLKGGESGPAIEPGDPAASNLVDAVRWESFEMPPDRKLPAADAAAFSKWIKLGAPWPIEAPPAAATTAKKEFPFAERMRHWSFQPVKPVSPPDVKHTSWPAGDVDRFILARLEAKQLKPAPPADKETLARRLYFDLVGLPPTLQQLDEFLNDASPHAYEHLVDALLASRHFGERWARHWLDLVRYAETHGHEFDYPIVHAHEYRDYVIRAFNADVPYNQFVIEHVAGDILTDPRRHPTEQYNESVIGTGFWFLGEATHAPVDVRGDEAGRVDNQIDVFSKAFLGVTLACARCHDHKFDPITTQDYYGMAGFIQSSRRQEALLDPRGRIQQKLTESADARSRADEQLAKSFPSGHESLSASISEYLLASRDVIKSGKKPEDVAIAAKLNAAAILNRWVAALKDKQAAQPASPMFLWSSVLPLEADAQTLRKKLIGVDRRVQGIARQNAEVAQKSPTLADFSRNNLDNWYVTGHAFSEGATKASDFDLFTPQPTPLTTGVAHSGRAGRKLQGVIRSKTFELTTRFIDYHIAGKNAQVRLVVDGYHMDVFSALLFSGFTYKVDHGDALRWHRQDVSRYLGHRAYIEIIDHSDGFVAVDEIRFCDDNARPTDVATVSTDILASLTPATNDSAQLDHKKIAHAIGKQVSRSLARRAAGKATNADIQLIAWLTTRDLLEMDAPSREQLAPAVDAVRQIDQQTPTPMKVIAIADGSGEDERIHIRGSHKNLGPHTPRRLLAAIAGHDQPPIENNSGRLELARRMTDPSNPFIARTIVNRLWHHLLGRGIVPSVDNFGKLGTEPSHPQLLDHLATQFIADGWSLKTAVKSIVMSNTYRMSSKPADAQAEAADPDNQLWHRMPIRRLQAEAIRDSILLVSGRLDRKHFGPPIDVHLTPFMTGRGRPKSGPLDGAGRRSIYTSVKRNFLPPMMLAFDTPIPFNSVGRRTVSNVPAQALILMNDEFVSQQSKLWAQQIVKRADLAPRERIEAMYRTAFSRGPSDSEANDALAFLNLQAQALGVSADRIADDERLWSDLCHILFNVKEFIYLN